MAHDPSIPDDNPLLQAALSCATRHWPVFPCHLDKSPKTKHGFKDATTDVTQITAWWTTWPDASIGMPTGLISRTVVIDRDPRNGGDLTFDDLETEHGKFPRTVESFSGGGGGHLFYAHPGGKVSGGTHALGPGVDVLADGKYVILAPSPHPSGRCYEWEITSHPNDCPLAPLPEWIPLEDETEEDPETGKRRSMEDYTGDRPGDDYNRRVTREEVRLLLAEHGWSVIEHRDGVDYLRRPGKTSGMYSASLGYLKGNRLKVFSTSDPILQAKKGGYQPWALYAILMHGRNFKAATKALADRGYGRNGQPKDAAQSSTGKAFHTPSNGEDHQEATPGNRLVIPWSDYTNAVELVETHGQNLRYCHPAKSWYVWDGKRWLADETAAVMRLATDAIKAMAIRIISMNNPESKALLAHLKTSLSTSKLKALVDQASWLSGIPVLPKQLDQHPWLLNCQNGTLDLRTGELLKHRRDDLITMITAAEYHPDARSKVWESFLLRMLPDESDRRYVQKAAGYSLTGLGTEDVLFFPFGPTKTGKSTLLKGLRATWGDYATTADFETFLTREHVTGAPRADIAGLAGKRLVVSLEVDQGKKLAEALIKWLFGGDYVTARFLYKKEFEFLPTFKLWLASNHRPQVSSDDDAIWERIRQIPFEQAIPKEERDPGIKAELSDPEQSGAAILAWAVEGCLLWKQEGLGVPKHVEDTTNAYRKEMDPMPDFIEACLVNDDKGRVLNAAMWECYQGWSRKNRDRPKLGRKTFTQRLEQAGIDRLDSGGYHFWVGVRLRYHATGDAEESEKPPEEL